MSSSDPWFVDATCFIYYQPKISQSWFSWTLLVLTLFLLLCIASDGETHSNRLMIELNMSKYRVNVWDTTCLNVNANVQYNGHNTQVHTCFTLHCKGFLQVMLICQISFSVHMWHYVLFPQINTQVVTVVWNSRGLADYPQAFLKMPLQTAPQAQVVETILLKMAFN